MRRIFACVIAFMLLILSVAHGEEVFSMAGYDSIDIGHDWTNNLFFQRMEEKTGVKFAFQQYTDATITSRDALQKELDLIRQRGYAMEISEYKPGMRSVAAPIFDEEKRVRYAIGVIGMFQKSEADQFTNAVSVVVETAKKISETF